MLEAFRVVKADYADTAFDGEGARRSGGRFNSAGTRAVYCSDSLALALLEVAVHLPSYRGLRGRVSFQLSFKESLVETLEEADLPKDWRSTPPSRSSQNVGDVWIAEGRSAILSVPSVLLPNARNYLLNPLHPDFAKITIAKPEPIPIDPRLEK